MASIPDRADPAAAKRASDDRNLGILLIVFLTVFWGLNWPAMKLALGEIPPLTFRTLCLAVGGVGLLAIAKLGGHSIAIPRGRTWPLLLSALVNVTGWHVFTAYGLPMIGAGRAAIIAYTMPIWAAFFAGIFLGERLGLRRWIGMAVGMGGLSLLLIPGLDAIAASPLGTVLILMAALSWGGGTVVAKYFTWGMPTVSFVGWSIVLGGVPVVIGALMIEPLFPVWTISMPAMAGLVYSLLFPMILCHWAYFKVVDLFPANVAALSTLPIPMVGVLSSAWLLGEPIGWLEIASLALVTLALAIILMPTRR